MTLFCTRFPIESKDHTHDHGSIGLYFEHSVFSSLFMWGGTLPVGSDLEWQSQRKNHFKMGFPFASGHLPRRKIIWSDDLLFSFFHWSGITLFSSDLFLLTFFRSLIGNPSFPFFSFFPFLSFHFFLFFLFISPSPFLSLGNQVLAFVICSPLRRFRCPLLRGKGWGFFL